MHSQQVRYGAMVAGAVALILVSANDPVLAQPANQPPVAVHDVAEVVAGPGAGVTVDVRANDFDPDGDALLVTGVGPASHGSTFVTSRGNPNYTPDAGFTGLDSFTYALADGRGATASGTVFVAVSSPTPTCEFRRGTTTCTTIQFDLESTERTVVSGCVAGPPPGVPGVRTQRFVDTELITTTTTTRSRGRSGPVYDTSTTANRDFVFSQLVSSTCEPVS